MKTCMFADFYKYEFGWDCVQNDFGFIFYYIKKEECYIPALWTRPENRQGYEAKKLFTEVVNIATDHGCAFMTAQIDCRPEKEESSSRIMKCYLALGFKMVNAKDNQILVKYDLEEKERSL